MADTGSKVDGLDDMDDLDRDVSRSAKGMVPRCANMASSTALAGRSRGVPVIKPRVDKSSHGRGEADY